MDWLKQAPAASPQLIVPMSSSGALPPTRMNRMPMAIISPSTILNLHSSPSLSVKTGANRVAGIPTRMNREV